MNRKGFTLIELIAVLLILGLVVGITVYSVSGVFTSAKGKTEEVFVETIKDAIDVYLSDGSPRDINNNSLNFIQCTKSITKSHGTRKVYRAVTTFKSVINSKYKPISENDIVNPANEDVPCNKDFVITIFRDEDYVYYYSVERSELGCLVDNKGKIHNLPKLQNGDYYSCS